MFSCLFKILEVTCIPWLLASSLQVQQCRIFGISLLFFLPLSLSLSPLSLSPPLSLSLSLPLSLSIIYHFSHCVFPVLPSPSSLLFSLILILIPYLTHPHNPISLLKIPNLNYFCKASFLCKVPGIRTWISLKSLSTCYTYFATIISYSYPICFYGFQPHMHACMHA